MVSGNNFNKSKAIEGLKGLFQTKTKEEKRGRGEGFGGGSWIQHPELTLSGDGGFSCESTVP